VPRAQRHRLFADADGERASAFLLGPLVDQFLKRIDRRVRTSGKAADEPAIVLDLNRVGAVAA
jgi:hypothetical protein